MPMFFTQSGWLTRYALSCGYKHAQKRSFDGQDVEMTCINLETPTYLVRRYNGPDKTFELYTHSIVFARRMFKHAMEEPLQWRFEPNSEIRRLVIQ